MRTTSNIVLRKTVAAAVLAAASVGVHAGHTNLSAVLHGGPQFTATGGGFGANSVNAGVWEVDFGGSHFYAFGLEPSVAFNGASNHYTTASFNASDAVKRLYESYYDTVMLSNLNNPAPKAKAFQLALWELNNDNGNLLSGNLRFNSLSNAVVADAKSMLTTALGNSVIENRFNYAALNSAGMAINSQRMLTVSAVPEPQTWALTGLGLMAMAFVARRRKVA